MRVLTSMGVQVHQTADGRLQLSHVPGKATSSELAEEGLSFMKEMLELAQSQQEAVVDPRIVQIRPSGESFYYADRGVATSQHTLD